jgi:DNA-directed RNA polymerase specialized sigma24 family protein
MLSGPHVEKLPPMERDILRLHLDLRKSQTEVARILGVSQPTVNYRYKRARERLDFMERLPSVSPDDIRLVLSRLGARDRDIEAMVLYVETNSQSEVARRMETSQGAVRHWIHRALVNHLQNDMSPDEVHRRVRTACGLLVNRPGIFNEPSKPSNGVRPHRVEHRLPSAPRTEGRLLVGEHLTIVDGTYENLAGTVVAVSENVWIRLDLESVDITLMWPR